ncbi:MAG: hypothetical protein ACRCTK_05530 [Alphaproteobacteria bacterium]
MHSNFTLSRFLRLALMALTAPQVVLAGQGDTDQKPRRERSGAISRGSTQAVQPFIPNEQQARDFF